MKTSPLGCCQVRALLLYLYKLYYSYLIPHSTRPTTTYASL